MGNFYSVNSKGTCVPSNDLAFFAFKLVQNEANRFQDAAGRELLVCDGKLGKNTLAAINSVANTFPTTGVLGKTTSSCKEVADNAGNYAAALKNVADQQKLPIVTCPKGIIQQITHPEPKIDESGTVVYPSIATAGFGGVPLWLIALAGVGGVYYFKKTKGGKKQWKSLTGGF